jgi:lysozyme
MTRLADRYDQLVAQGWGPTFPLPFVDIPVGDGQGTFFSWVTSNGVGVTIYDKPGAEAAFEVHGAILDSYVAQGGPLGALGYPVSDEKDDAEGTAVLGRVSDFERGSIFWTRDTGEITTMTIGPVLGGDFELFDGIDVSSAQGAIDWSRVAGGGFSFAYIKATDGNIGTDPTFTANWSASRGQLARGAYHVFHPTTAPEASRTQADHFAAVLGASGDGGELAPVVDVELGGATPAQCVASLQFFLGILSQSIGRQPVIYTYPNFWRYQMGASSAFAQGFRLWIASYGNPAGPPVGNQQPYNTRPNGPLIPPGWREWTVWQHAVLAGVPGIATLVDRDSAMPPAGTPLVTYLG